jgi:hypothetical protein
VDHKGFFVQVLTLLCGLLVQVADRRRRLEPEPAERQRLGGVRQRLQLLAHAHAIGG